MATKGKVEGIVDIQGRDYRTVAFRLKHFREDHPDWTISTEIVHLDDDGAVMKATILDEEGRVRGTGHAEEKRAANMINRSSALENCETSAVGRALAACNYLGSDVASEEELEEHRADAIVHYFIHYLERLRANWDVVVRFKQEMRDGLDGSEARARLSRSLDEKDLRTLWKAPSKGSVFETWERDKTGATKKPDDLVDDPDGPVIHPKMEQPWTS